MPKDVNPINVKQLAKMAPRLSKESHAVAKDKADDKAIKDTKKEVVANDSSHRNDELIRLHHAYNHAKNGIDRAKCEVAVYQLAHSKKVVGYRLNPVPFPTLGRILLESSLHMIEYDSGATQHLAFYDGRKTKMIGGKKEKNAYYGLYRLSSRAFKSLLSIIYPNFSERHLNDLLDYLFPRIPDYRDGKVSPMERYIPLGNGAWDKKTHELVSYNPKLVFFAKSQVCYNPEAGAVVAVGSWTFERWLHTIVSKGQVGSLLKAMYDFIDCNQTHNKTVGLIGPARAGKSMLINLMVALAGKQNVCNIPITDFNKPFALGNLPGKIACIGDNVTSNVYIRGNGSLHSAISGDSVPINQKNEKAYSINFHGLIMFASNGYPRFADKLGMPRRILFIKFVHQFNGDRPDIEDKVLSNQKMLEHVLWILLNKVGSFSHYTRQECYTNNPAFKEWDDKADPVDEFLTQWLLPLTKTHGVDKIPSIIALDVYKSWAQQRGYNTNVSIRKFTEHAMPKLQQRGWKSSRSRLNKAECGAVNTNIVGNQPDEGVSNAVSGKRYMCFVLAKAHRTMSTDDKVKKLFSTNQASMIPVIAPDYYRKHMSKVVGAIAKEARVGSKYWSDPKNIRLANLAYLEISGDADKFDVNNGFDGYSYQHVNQEIMTSTGWTEAQAKALSNKALAQNRGNDETKKFLNSLK